MIKSKSVLIGSEQRSGDRDRYPEHLRAGVFQYSYLYIQDQVRGADGSHGRVQVQEEGRKGQSDQGREVCRVFQRGIRQERHQRDHDRGIQCGRYCFLQGSGLR